MLMGRMERGTLAQAHHFLAHRLLFVTLRSNRTMRRVADAIVERLLAPDTRQVFPVAGESYLDVLDALFVVRDALHVVTCRHEAAAANMAEATAKLTRPPGVAFVTRGPGLTHASIGFHPAQQDATPMVLLVGEIDAEESWPHGFSQSGLIPT